MRLETPDYLLMINRTVTGPQLFGGFTNFVKSHLVLSWHCLIVAGFWWSISLCFLDWHTSPLISYFLDLFSLFSFSPGHRGQSFFWNTMGKRKNLVSENSPLLLGSIHLWFQRIFLLLGFFQWHVSFLEFRSIPKAFWVFWEWKNHALSQESQKTIETNVTEKLQNGNPKTNLRWPQLIRYMKWSRKRILWYLQSQ